MAAASPLGQVFPWGRGRADAQLGGPCLGSSSESEVGEALARAFAASSMPLFEDAVRDLEALGASAVGGEVAEGHVLALSARCVERFVGANAGTTDEKRDALALDAAAADGEDAHGGARGVRDLLCARRMLEGMCANDNAPPTAAWWALRAALWHQRLLMAPAASLRAAADRHARTLRRRFLARTEAEGADGDDDDVPPPLVPAATGGAHGELACLLRLELAAHSFLHSRVDDGCAHVDAACAAIGLDVSTAGHLGKRTEHQIDDKAQLIVRATPSAARAASSERPDDGVGVPTPHADVNYVADADAGKDEFGISNVLPRPVLSDGSVDDTAHLSAIEQACVLGCALKVKRATASDDLQLWEVSQYAYRLLGASPSPPLVQSWCELTLARHEKLRGRTLERGYMRMRHIVDKRCAAEADLEPAALAQRTAFAHCVPFPLLFVLMKELGEFELSLGMVNEAMRIFEAYELYDHLISCYVMLDKKPAAEALVRERLEVEPERALLWCILGDVTRDKAHYEKAWEVSGNRHARSQRSLARMAHAMKDYREAAVHYELALGVNPLNASGWFDLGFCYMQLAGLDEAPTVGDVANDGAGSTSADSGYVDRALAAFTRCVQNEPDHSQAWNNLAILSLRKGYHARAFVALEETVKWNKESWQLWENYAAVALELGKFTAALRGLSMVFKLTASKLYSSSRKDGEGEHMKTFRFDETMAARLVERAIAVGVGGADEGGRVDQDVAIGERDRADRAALLGHGGGDRGHGDVDDEEEEAELANAASGGDDDVGALEHVAELLDPSSDPEATHGNGTAAPAAAPAPRKQGAALFVANVRRLISKVTAAPGMGSSTLHKLVARLDAAAGDFAMAEEGWLRYVRSLGLTQWGKEREAFDAYAEGVLELCRLFVRTADIAEADAAMDAEERSMLRKKKLTAAQLQLNSTAKASADAFGDTALHTTLCELLDEVKAKLSALRQELS